MSGHSHYATIKRQKESKDAQKGQIFSKLSRAISLAVKTGGGGDSDSNYKLRMAVDQAKAANMPKDNIERAIERAVGGAESLEEVTYEGFGPDGVAVMVEVATDNRNRTGQEIKNMFERIGGSLGGPGSVAFNFDKKGLIVVAKASPLDDQILKLIDLEVDNVEETQDGVEVYVEPDKVSSTADAIKNLGFSVISAELVQNPKTYTTVNDPDKASKILTFLDKLEEHDDVQKVFANVDIPEELIAKLQTE